MTITDPYKEIHALREKIAKMYDEYAGTPCERIRHMEEVAELREEIERLKTENCTLAAGSCIHPEALNAHDNHDRDSRLDLIGQCRHCGGNLTSSHRCPAVNKVSFDQPDLPIPDDCYLDSSALDALVMYLGESMANDLFDIGSDLERPHRIQFKGGEYPDNERSMGGFSEKALARYLAKRLKVYLSA